ncbi:MAG: hypothetical protein WC073_12770 [Sterolibacterium sp.]
MRPATDPGLLRKLVALVSGAILLILGLVFSLALLVVIVILGFAAGCYFWWRTRAIRKAMREQHPNGQVIDGEATIVEEYQVVERNALPRDPPTK